MEDNCPAMQQLLHLALDSGAFTLSRIRSALHGERRMVCQAGVQLASGHADMFKRSAAVNHGGDEQKAARLVAARQLLAECIKDAGMEATYACRRPADLKHSTSFDWVQKVDSKLPGFKTAAMAVVTKEPLVTPQLLHNWWAKMVTKHKKKTGTNKSEVDRLM
jgi:hypothetical protein